MKLIARSWVSRQAVAEIGLGGYLVKNAVGIDNSREGEAHWPKFNFLGDNLIVPPDATKQSMAKLGQAVGHAEC